MAGKLLLVMNALRERGQELELALALAEAAREHGLQPLLATHVACPAELIPDSLDWLPIFCDDPASSAPPNLFHLRGDLQALTAVSAETVRRGEHSVEDLLRAYFTFPSAEPWEPPPANPEPQGLARANHNLQDLLPPRVRHVLRRYYRGPWRSRLRRLVRACVPAVFRPFLRRTFRGSQAVPVPAPVEQVSSTGDCQPPVADPLLGLSQSLTKIGCREDLERCGRFQRDLERLLCLVQTTPADQVFLVTAHCRELLAIQRVLRRLDADRAPRFHARFSFSVAAPRIPYLRPPTAEEQADFQFRKVQQLYLDWFVQYGDRDRVQLHAASQELAEEFEHLTDLPFQALPQVFPLRLARGPSDTPATRLLAALLHPLPVRAQAA